MFLQCFVGKVFFFQKVHKCHLSGYNTRQGYQIFKILDEFERSFDHLSSDGSVVRSGHSFHTDKCYPPIKIHRPILNVDTFLYITFELLIGSSRNLIAQYGKPDRIECNLFDGAKKTSQEL